ncbi:GNAT family N-acetyltransferase [Albimonas pacifica]|uniref:Ribosomal-protein-alanine N-acetyltransferase n=1 Tax=Albimonas pacifica TaxID=1114924 RepID=A0A1I3L1E9_9RHOB|nr:GNAT family N-acetyltransferase [Albimonas pacifica]SFI78583.1 ribosomal-protein-alanine N-acetyltransferase [Albimonas pacifica]
MSAPAPGALPELAARLAADPALAAAAAQVHAAAFDGTVPGRPWSAAEIAGFAAVPGALALLTPDALLLGRVAGPEAELVALATRPSARRRGLGRALTERFVALAAAAGAEEAFLEVAATNAPAQALYAALGWRPVGRRRGYYRDVKGNRIDAVAMRLRPIAVEARTSGDGAA